MSNTSSLLRLLQASKSHLGTRNVLFGILQVFKESVFVPSDAFVAISSGVSVTFYRTSLTPKEAIEIRS